MRRPPRDLHELSLAVRDLRAALGMTQQQFAEKLPTALRTLARWENNEPPHGKVLVRLAQLAEAQDFTEIGAKFVSALNAERPAFDAAAEPELKDWVDGLEVAFRYRFRFVSLWSALTEGIIDLVDSAAADARQVRSREAVDLANLARQLRNRLEREK
jgi:transcriptional regulator with XRE-family HTH domain